MGLLGMIGPSDGRAGYTMAATWKAISVLEQLQRRDSCYLAVHLTVAMPLGHTD